MCRITRGMAAGWQALARFSIAGRLRQRDGENRYFGAP
jgi:hypothetical protein